jgi:hypothetical protein
MARDTGGYVEASSHSVSVSNLHKGLLDHDR